MKSCARSKQGWKALNDQMIGGVRLLFLALFLLLSFHFRGTAQDGSDEGKHDTTVFQARSDSVWELMRKDIRTALSLAEKNLRFAKKAGFGERLGVAHSDLGAALMNSGKSKEALEHIRSSMALDRKEGDTSGIISAHINMGLNFRRISQYDSALAHFREAIRINKEKGTFEGIPSLYNNIGNIHRERSDLVKGLKYYHKALDMIDSLDMKEKGTIYGNLGIVHKERKAYDKAFEMYKKALRIFKKQDDHLRIATTQLNIGQILQKKGDSAAGLDYFRKAYRKFDEVGDPRRKGMVLVSIADHYHSKGKDDSCLHYLQRAMKIGKRIDALPIILAGNSTKAEILVKRGRPQEALDLAKEGYEQAEKVGNLDWKKAFAVIAYRALKDLGRYREALSFHEEWSSLKDSLKNEERAEKLTRMNMRYKFEKEQMRDSLEHAKEIRVREEELEKQRTVRNFLLGGGAVLLLFLFLLFERFRTAKKRKKEVDQAYGELHEKNRELEDSIHYASRIQGAILTGDAYREKVLGEHFISFMPKEVVSGDFYWAYGDERYSIWLAADCTGHGVPGAFMSMIGNRLFNEVVVEQGERDPGKVLERVRQGIIEALEQNQDEETKDGMDAALCVLDKQERELRFAGAHNSLYLIQSSDEEPPIDGKSEEKEGYRAIEVKGDRSSIGRNPEKGAVSFQTVSIPLKGGERTYTFSDGFPDQFGGEKGKKYRYRPFKQFLLSIQDRGMKEQGQLLEEEFRRWKGEQEQIDDVLVIGVQVPSS